jgi:hypothetical protein
VTYVATGTTVELRAEPDYVWTDMGTVLSMGLLAPGPDHAEIVGTGPVLTDDDDSTYAWIRNDGSHNTAATSLLTPPSPTLLPQETESCSQIRFVVRFSGAAAAGSGLTFYLWYPYALFAGSYGGVAGIAYRFASPPADPTTYDIIIDPTDPNVSFPDGNGYDPAELMRRLALGGAYISLVPDNTGAGSDFNVYEFQTHFTYMPYVWVDDTPVDPTPAPTTVTPALTAELVESGARYE